MKLIFERDRLSAYFSKFRLDQFFSRPEELPIQIRAYERNEQVLIEGDELDGLYFQVEGRTKVSSSVRTGKSLLLRFCYPLSIFGDVEFWQKVTVQSQVEAVQPSIFCLLTTAPSNRSS